MQRFLMTPEGYEALQKELAHLKEVVRHQIVKDIEEAIAHGDLSENSEYEDAKQRQSLCEGRIQDLSARVNLAEVIDITKIPPSDRVVFGVTVEIEDVETEELMTYKIVGELESDVKHGKISVTSPIARAMIGKEVGDEVVVKTPRGNRRMAISDVRYK
ncbi:MAG: transcription elongation factor GreA [Myxococcota bacterium]